MSIQTWLAEYMPTTAQECAERGNVVECLAHSTRKWEGLKPENLEKHGLHRIDRLAMIADDGRHDMLVASETCALCALHSEISCERCILYRVRNDVDCSTRTPEEYISPWSAWQHYGKVQPMLDLLHEASRFLAKEK